MAAQIAFTAWSVFDPAAISFLIGCFLHVCMRVLISSVLLSVGSWEGFQRAKSSRKLINSSRVHVFAYHMEKRDGIRAPQSCWGQQAMEQFEAEHTWSVGVLVWFVSLVSHKPCRRMGFHKGEDWTWDIFPAGSSLTVRISRINNNPQISAFQSII